MRNDSQEVLDEPLRASFTETVEVPLRFCATTPREVLDEPLRASFTETLEVPLRFCATTPREVLDEPLRVSFTETVEVVPLRFCATTPRELHRNHGGGVKETPDDVGGKAVHAGKTGKLVDPRAFQLIHRIELTQEDAFAFVADAGN